MNLRRLVDRMISPRIAWIVAALGILLSVVILVAGGSTASTATGATDALPDGAASTAVTELSAELPAGQLAPAIVVVTRPDEGPLTAVQRQALERAAAGLADEASGGDVGPPVISQDGTVGLVTVPLAATASADLTAERVDAIRASAESALPDDVVVRITGAAGFQSDVSKIFEGTNTTLLIATASIVALLLLVTYRSPWLWIVPLVVVGLADRVAIVAAVRASDLTRIPVDDAATGIVSVLVFGAGTNYALLLVSRYRDELRREADPYAAMRTAVVRAGEAIVASAGTVIAALATLLLSVFPVTRGLGMAGAIGIAIALVYALVVLPAALVPFGRRLFWPFIPRAGQAQASTAPGLWRRIGEAVRRRPAVVAAASLVVLVGLAAGATQISTGLSQNESFLETPGAVVAQERVALSFPAGQTDPVEIISPAGDAARVRDAVGSVDGVAAVESGSASATLAQTNAVLAAPPGSDEARATVDRIEAAVAGVPGTFVGGSLAQEMDRDAAVARDRLVIVPLILLIVTALLVILLRSLLAPVLLVATVVLTFLASLGASWWIFRTVFDFPALSAEVPLLAFLFLVALGVDYNIFLVARAREEARRVGTREGIIRGLAATGGVITSAGILLAAVFAVLGVLPLILLTQIGIIVGIGVLLDTLLVRTVLVPSLVMLLGDRFWWPNSAPAPAGGDGDARVADGSQEPTPA